MRRTDLSRSALRDAARFAVVVGVLFGAVWLAGWVLLRSGWCDPILRTDRHIAVWVSAHRTPWVTSLMRGWTALGTTVVLVPLVIGAGLLFRWRARTWRPLLLLVVTTVGLPLLYSPLKHLLARPRPRIPPIVATERSWAFPSGHSTQAAAMAVLLVGLLLPRVGSSLGSARAGRAGHGAGPRRHGLARSSSECTGPPTSSPGRSSAACGAPHCCGSGGGQRALTRKSAAPRK